MILHSYMLVGARQTDTNPHSRLQLIRIMRLAAGAVPGKAAVSLYVSSLTIPPYAQINDRKTFRKQPF